MHTPKNNLKFDLHLEKKKINTNMNSIHMLNLIFFIKFLE